MFGFIAKHRGIWPVSWMCEALGVSRSGFHAWLTRPPSAKARSDEALGARVRESFVRSDRTYGARRVWHDVLAEGLSCGLHRVERLMRAQALRAGRGADGCQRIPATAQRSHQRARPGVRGGPAEPQMGRRLHLCLDGRRMALRRRGARPVLAAYRRLVDEGGDDGVARHRRAGHGDLAARPAAGAAAPLRPGQPVYQRAVPAADGRSRHRLLDEPGGQRLGQRRDGELLLVAQDRADQGACLPDPR